MTKDSDRIIEWANYLEEFGEHHTPDKVARDLRQIAIRVRRQEHLITQIEGEFKSFSNKVMF